jgi:hypothetical protein
MSFLHSLHAVGSMTNVSDVLRTWDPSFIQMIIEHFNVNYIQFSVILGISLEKIKTNTATNALYAIAMMTSVKMVMKGYMQRIDSMSYPQIHSRRLERVKETQTKETQTKETKTKETRTKGEKYI